MARITIGLGLSLALLGIALLTGCGSTTSAANSDATYQPRVQRVEVKVSTVQRESLVAESEFTGNLLPRKLTRIMAEVDGVVREIPQADAPLNLVVEGRHYSERLGLSYGQQIKQGDVLVQLDSRDAEVALRMAEAKLAKAEADLAHLQAWQRPEEVQRLAALRDEASARHAQALHNFRRMETLVQRNVVTQSDFENASTEVATLRAALAASEAALAVAQAGPTAAEIAVQHALIAQGKAELEQQQRTIEKGTIRAPYDAVITAFSVEVGDRVSPAGNPVVELMDLRYLSAEIALPEAYVGQVALKDLARVEIAGSPDTVPGVVIAVNDYVDPQTRTFHVRVAVDNENGQFKAGQFARVRLPLGARDEQLVAVPREAILFVEGQPHVFVLQRETVHLTPVLVGRSNAALTEIRAGLQVGDLVVVDDPALLADGMAVSVRSATSATPQDNT